jgi:hypothetical protein
MKSPILNFIINTSLLFMGSGMAFSGFLIQFNYHMGHDDGIDVNYMVYTLNYSEWSDIHKIAIILFSILMIFHTILHLKWYKTVITKKLYAKNKQLIILSVFFILSAITGYIAWLIQLTGSQDITRKAIIEIHDKIVIILFVYLILHVTKRLKWFINSFYKLRNNHTAHISSYK